MRTFYLNLIVSIALIVGGFFVPPLGVIDGSVITSVGILLMFAVLATMPDFLKAVHEGKHIKFTKGDFSAEVSCEHETNE